MELPMTNAIRHVAVMVNEHELLRAKARALGVSAEELNRATATVIDLLAAGLTPDDLQEIAKAAASGGFSRPKTGKH